MARFPSFCTEYDVFKATNSDSIENACSRELSTLLAHMVYATADNSEIELKALIASGFSYKEDKICSALSPASPSCNFYED